MQADHRIGFITGRSPATGSPPSTGYGPTNSSAPRTAVAEWLEALVTDQEPENITEASMAAIQTAALISLEIRLNESLGDIVLMANGKLKAPDPERIFLPDGGRG